jgi:hypothetical protein
MTDKANGLTREQYHAAGWSDEQLVQHGIMLPPGGGGAPQAPAAPATPPPAAPSAPKYQMTDKANGLTREQYHAAGWSDEQLVQHGIMLPPGGVAPSFA